MNDGAVTGTAASQPDPAISDWEDRPGRAPTDKAPILSVDGFEGPLDWLLEMVRAKQIDLARLSIAALIEAFSGAMDAALASWVGTRVDPQLGRWAAWTVMAATLTELWSRLLLPADAPEARAAGAEAEALRRQLLGRAQMRAAADWMERQPQSGWEVFCRGMPEVNASGRIGDITELLRACLVALRVPDAQAAADRPRPPRYWRVGDAIRRLQQLLGELPDGSPLTGFLPTIGDEEPDRGLRCRVAVASTLIAGLELARDGAVALDQDEAWTPIRVRNRAERASISGSEEHRPSEREFRSPDTCADGPSRSSCL